MGTGTKDTSWGEKGERERERDLKTSSLESSGRMKELFSKKKTQAEGEDSVKGERKNGLGELLGVRKSFRGVELVLPSPLS